MNKYTKESERKAKNIAHTPLSIAKKTVAMGAKQRISTKKTKPKKSLFNFNHLHQDSTFK